MVSFLSHSSGETDLGKVKEKLSSGFTLASFPDLPAIQFLLQLDSLGIRLLLHYTSMIISPGISFSPTSLYWYLYGFFNITALVFKCVNTP